MNARTSPFNPLHELGWQCDVCREWRPDATVSVHKIDALLSGHPIQINAKFCNDRPECEAAVKAVRTWAEYNELRSKNPSHTRLEPSPCPTCGYMVDAHTAIGGIDGRPEIGCPGVCCKCGEVALFGLGFRLERPPDGFLGQMRHNDFPAWFTLMRASRLVRKHRRTKQ